MGLEILNNILGSSKKDESIIVDIPKIKDYSNNKINNETQEEQKLDLNNKLPRIQLNELPSGFISYPKNSKVFYTPMTLKELDLLNSGTINVEEAMKYLLDSIDCEGFNKYDLAYFDVVYIGVKRKLTAMGDCMGMLVKQCPNCGNYVEYKFNYTDLDFDDCKLESLPITVDFECAKGLQFSFLTIKDWLDLDTDSKTLSIYAKLIKNVPYEESLNLIENLTGNDIKKLYEIEDKLSYGIKPFKIKCNHPIEDIQLDDKGEPHKITKDCGTDIEMEVTSPYEVIFCES